MARCHACEKVDAIARVQIDALPKRKDGAIGQGDLCRGCLRKVLRAMGLESEMPPDNSVPNIFEDT